MKLTGRNIAVTGGAGFIGSHLVERIIQESPRNMVVIDNLFLGREENLEQAKEQFPTLHFYKVDASDYDTMKDILKNENVEVVYNLAVIPLPASLEKPRWTIDVNIAITNIFCELLREGFYQTLIHFSSSEAYGTAQFVPMNEEHPINPETPYAASKVAGDYIVLSYRNTFGIDAVIVRPFNNYGPRQNKGAYAGIIPIVVQKAANGESVIIYGDGEQTRDFIFVKDTVNAAVKIYENPATRGKIINIASGHETSINQLVRKILYLMGSNVKIIYDVPRLGDVRRHCGDISLVKNLIGFEPSIIDDNHLRQTINWYIKR